MTVAQFMTELEGYYGPFQRPTQRKHVAAYLASEWPESQLSRLLKWAIETIPAKYNYVPDVAAFEKIRPELKHRMQVEVPPPDVKLLTEAGEEFVDPEEAKALFRELREHLKQQRGD